MKRIWQQALEDLFAFIIAVILGAVLIITVIMAVEMVIFFI